MTREENKRRKQLLAAAAHCRMVSASEQAAGFDVAAARNAQAAADYETAAARVGQRREARP